MLAAALLASCTSLKGAAPDSGIASVADGGLTGGTKDGGGTGGGGTGGGTGGAVGGSGATGGGQSSTGGAPQTDAGLDAPAGKPAMLVVAPSNTYDFGRVEIGHASSAATFTVTNKGDLPTGALSLSLSNTSHEISPTNGCTASLAAGASCTIAASFTPTAPGTQGVSLILSASSGGSVTIDLTVTGLVRLTVTATGSGQITSTPAGITCGTTCTGLFSEGAIALNAHPDMDQRFAGWSGGDCPAGVATECKMTLAQATTVTASFAAVTANLVFQTISAIEPRLGDVVNYDARCNAAATAAGLNDAAGTAFIAFISSSTSMAAARLGNARGWIRLDGKPFIDTLAAAFGNHQVFNTIGFYENGKPVSGGSSTITGVSSDGTLDSSETCSDWSSADGQAVGGQPNAGPGAWASASYISCTGAASLLCFGRKKSSPVAPAVSSGKRIWVSGAYVVGGPSTPDQTCQASRPSGVTTAVALIATPTRAASALLTAGASYVRPDGTLVGTGAELALGQVKSGIWQAADGTYVSGPWAWTSSASPNVVGTAESTCANWTDASITSTAPRVGGLDHAGSEWFSDGSLRCDWSSVSLYCIQTAP